MNEVSLDHADLNSANLYINRELSFIEFNQRVLEQAKDDSVPVLERLRFLSISSTNLDEFFEVRVAGLLQMAELCSIQAGPDEMLPLEVLSAISTRLHQFVDEQYTVLNDTIFPLLEQHNIRFIRRSDWNSSQEQWLHQVFHEQLLPIITPLGLDPAHPFPRILNKSLNFIISLRGKDAFGRHRSHAIVQAPRALPRVIQLPQGDVECGPHDFVFLSSVIHAFVEELFPGMKIKGCYQFRVTRNSDLFVDEEAVDDLLRAVQGELASRRYGDAVRLEVDDQCPDETVSFLLERFGITARELYLVNGPVNLNRVTAIIDIIDNSALTYPPFTPHLPKPLVGGVDMFTVLDAQDILLHHPYESFAPVVDLLKHAAVDADVLSIKQTLYRSGAESVFVEALVAAARAGKEVTVVVELRARFDEEANIGLANRLQEAGVHVVYGVVGYKTHAKMLHIVRRQGKQLKQYVHLGTGNYHSSTARLYTDYSLLSSNNKLGKDVHSVFLQLTSLGKVPSMQKILQAPFSLHQSLLDLIEQEISFIEQGLPGRIIIKVNSLTEPRLIRALYKASSIGVEVILLVRGLCCLRPGLPGVSDNIQVRSVVGRFLEHTRVYYFENNGDPKVYCASADWMDRNMFQRVEVCFPIDTKQLKERVIGDLNLYLSDNCNTWSLQKDGTYVRVEKDKDAVVRKKKRNGKAKVEEKTGLSAQAELIQAVTQY
ncbi:MAG: polyphosphate kinase 1 [Gammaproteobacteria bacterium]|nr:polyphosphate kinase 1 [Gammaproteobacteria bacterium]MDH5800883.1 polyphosphate kinase 1 [Gammaproteobacteria bacterium]